MAVLYSRVPFRVLFYEGAVLFWGPKRGTLILENYPHVDTFVITRGSGFGVRALG